MNGMEQSNSENGEYVKSDIFTRGPYGLAAFLGGPLAATIIISKNYKAFGNKRASQNSLIIGIAATALLILSLYLIPDNIMEYIPNISFAVIYFAVSLQVYQKYQKDKSEKYLLQHGQELEASYWKAAGFGLLGLLASLALVVVLAVLMAIMYAILSLILV